MSYPARFQESLSRIKASRSRRISETFARIALDERDEILAEYHPDFIDSAFRRLQIGPNQGDRAPLELADVLEAPAHITAQAISLEHPDSSTDVLVLGGGGAGASAALLARAGGAQVLLATKLRFGDANTMMAQGGIQAADKANDSPALHYLDVLGGGHFSNNPELAAALVLDAPAIIAWLEALGVIFDKELDGSMRTIHGGGTCRKRMHAARDYTGAEIMRVLRDEVRSFANNSGPAISVWEFRPALELVLDERGAVSGAVLRDLDTGRLLFVRAKAVIIATGGSGRLHYQGFPTTNHYGATGDGLVMAYRAGAKLALIDTMQYHPTGAAFPEQIIGQLVTEKVRALGAQVLNADGEQFVHSLEPRDVEAAAIIRECLGRSRGVVTPTGQPAVWLDTPLIDILNGPDTIARELPAMVRQFGRFDMDMRREPILIYPTLHYQNGGIAIRPDGGTCIPGLYVAGEAAGGIHGRNRLMGNSLLDICVFGQRAGAAAAEWSHAIIIGQPSLAHLDRWEAERKQIGLNGKRPSPMLLPDYRHC